MKLNVKKFFLGWTIIFLITWAVWITALTCLGAWAMKLNVKKFFMGWTIIFLITWAVWIIGHEAHFKAHTHEFEKYGITWSLSRFARWTDYWQLF